MNGRVIGKAYICVNICMLLRCVLVLCVCSDWCFYGSVWDRMKQSGTQRELQKGRKRKSIHNK